jgi:hypothetical protein
VTPGSARGWTGPAAVMATAVTAAVTAARDSDAEAFTEATTALARLDRGQLTVLLGAVTRDLLESSHVDGVDVDAANEILRSCARFAVGWYPDFDDEPAVHALIGALGVAEPEDAPRPDELLVVAHGVLLIADQLAAQARDLGPVLDAALAELLRAQTVELP